MYISTSGSWDNIQFQNSISCPYLREDCGDRWQGSPSSDRGGARSSRPNRSLSARGTIPSSTSSLTSVHPRSPPSTPATGWPSDTRSAPHNHASYLETVMQGLGLWARELHEVEHTERSISSRQSIIEPNSARGRSLLRSSFTAVNSVLVRKSLNRVNNCYSPSDALGHGHGSGNGLLSRGLSARGISTELGTIGHSGHDNSPYPSTSNFLIVPNDENFIISILGEIKEYG